MVIHLAYQIVEGGTYEEEEEGDCANWRSKHESIIFKNKEFIYSISLLNIWLWIVNHS